MATTSTPVPSEPNINYDHGSVKKALVGRTIHEAFLVPEAANEEYRSYPAYLILSTDAGWLKLEPEGECCSVCFIQHVSLADALQGATVTGVEPIAQVKVDDPACDAVDSWGHRIHTSKGTCTIEMRVEHNGYYGGELSVETLPSKPAGTMRRLEDF